MKYCKLYSLIISCCIFLLSCEKTNIIPFDDCRIKKVSNYDENGNKFLEIIYSYEGSKVVMIEHTYTKPLFGVYDSRHSISYTDNLVNYIIETKRENNYIIEGKYEILSQDDRITEIVWSAFESGHYIQSKKMVYEYSDSILNKVRVSFVNNGEFKELGKIEITYFEGNIDKFSLYSFNDQNEWILSALRSYNYVEGKLADWTYSVRTESGEFSDVAKWVYYNINGLVTKIDKLENIFGEWMPQSSPTEFFYDKYDRLVKIQVGNSCEKVEYERGQGNATFFKFPEDKFYFEPEF